MYTPPLFKPDRAASLAFARSARLRHGLRLGRQQADRLVAAVLPASMPMTARRTPRFMSRVTIRW